MPVGTVSQHYLNTIKTRLTTSKIVITMKIIAEYALVDRGYIRARLTLVNGDFLELSEYFTVTSNHCAPKEYSYQWMNATKQHLVQRWDNATHFPNLPNAPHHIHIAQEENVVPGKQLSGIDQSARK